MQQPEYSGKRKQLTGNSCRWAVMNSLLLYIFHSVSSTTAHSSAQKEDTGNFQQKNKDMRGDGCSVLSGEGWGWRWSLLNIVEWDQTAYPCWCVDWGNGGCSTSPLPPITATRHLWCQRHQPVWIQETLAECELYNAHDEYSSSI